jgi:hypothetical protein
MNRILRAMIGSSLLGINIAFAMLALWSLWEFIRSLFVFNLRASNIDLFITLILFLVSYLMGQLRGKYVAWMNRTR